MAKVLCNKMSRSDDLLQWVNYLDALGYIVSSLSYSENSEEVFHQTGERLGMIISDYAQALQEGLEEAYGVLTKFFHQGDVSFLSDLRKTQKVIEEGFMGPEGNLQLIKETIMEIEGFVNGDFAEILRMQKAFEETGKQISRALTASEGEIRAQGDAEQKQPDSEITVTH